MTCRYCSAGTGTVFVACSVTRPVRNINGGTGRDAQALFREGLGAAYRNSTVIMTGDFASPPGR